MSDLSRLIALGEGYTTEFKQSMPSNLGAELCAFANATGGVVLIGVTDGGDAVGVGNHNRLKSQVRTIARSADPPIAVEVESAGDVLVVNVPEQYGKPYSFGGRFHIREGANCQRMSRDEIRESFYKEGLIRFDETLCPRFDLSRDLTPDTWSRFAARADIPDDMEPLTALENLHLVREGQMTHAGAWLLADDVTRYSPQAGVTCALLGGVTKTHILDLKNFTGDLYTIYEDCMGMVEQIGSGIRRIRQECRDYGVAEPLIEVSENWVTTTFRRPEAPPAGGGGTGPARPGSQPTGIREGTKSAPSRHQVHILRNCLASKSIREIMALAGRRDRTKFRHQVMQPLLAAGWLAMTIPDKPTSSRQRYRLTAAGRQLLDQMRAVE